MTIKLKRDGNGGYTTADGRWTIKPVRMGGGTTGWAGGRGWSNGHKAWHITDTTGKAVIAQYGPKNQRTVDALWEARDLIDYYTRKDGER